MPSLRVLHISSICIALFLPGCGTLLNIFPIYEMDVPVTERKHPAVFGGIGLDVKSISEGNVVYAPDIPFSLIGDLVALPIVFASRPHPEEQEDWRRTWFQAQPDHKAVAPAGADADNGLR